MLGLRVLVQILSAQDGISSQVSNQETKKIATAIFLIPSVIACLILFHSKFSINSKQVASWLL
jgi:hypothetical protein